MLAERDPAELPWGDLGVDVVIESTGFFTKREDAAKHLDGGREEGHHLGAGDRARRRRSCSASTSTRTTRRRTTSSPTRPARRTASRRSRRCCNDTVGIEHGLMTTIHAYTADQRLQDMPHNDLRRARAAALNLIPASTGAAKAIGLVIPELNGKLNGFAVRAPVPTGSVVDLTVDGEARDDRRGGQRGAEGGGRERPAEGILAYTEDPIVSSDIVKSPVLVDRRRAAHDRDGRHAGQGRLLVRQRVGLLEPRRRPGPAGRCEDARRPRRRRQARPRPRRLQRPARGRRGRRRHAHPRRAADDRGAARARGAR